MMSTKRGIKHDVQGESFRSGLERFNGLAVKAVRIHTLPIRKAVGGLDGAVGIGISMVTACCVQRNAPPVYAIVYIAPLQF